MPVLAKKNCFGANCHGSQAFSDLRFDTGVNFGAGEYGAVIKGISYLSNSEDAGLERQGFIRNTMQLSLAQPVGDKVSNPILHRFSDDMVKANRVKALGSIMGSGTRFVTLGDIQQSKFLLKSIPLSEGGVFHKGGNNFFVRRDDPDFQTLVQWLQIEKHEAEKSIRSDRKPLEGRIGEVRGILFVRTRRENKRRFFEVDTFQPGARLFVLPVRPGESVEDARGPAFDLSAQLGLTGEEDIRSPAVRYDARRVLFSMRRTEDDNFNVYEIALNEDLTYRDGSFRRLTYGPREVNGIRVHFVYPEYMPGIDDSSRFDLSQVLVIFASNLSGHVTASERRGILGEADGGTRNTILDRHRFEAGNTFAGRRIHIVSGTNSGLWSTIVGHDNHVESGEPSVIRVAPPFPEPVDETSVYVIEPDARRLPGFLPAYSVYRMQYAATGEEKEMFDATLNRITYNSEQSLNPSLRSSGEVMFTSLRNLQYRADKPVYNAGIFRVRFNGCDFHPHNMNRSGYSVVTDNRELPSGLEVRVGMDARNLWGGGALMFSDHQFGPDIEPDNPVDSLAKPYGKKRLVDHVPARASVRAIIPGEGTLEMRHSAFRFLRASMPYFPDGGPQAVAPTGVSPGGLFRDPYPMPDGSVLVSHCPSPVNHLDPDSNPDTDIFLVRPKVSLQREDEFRPGEMTKVKVPSCSATGTAEVYPRPIAIRLKEARKKKLFATAPLGPPETIRGYTGYPERTTAFLECYDYYTLDQLLDELTPTGRRLVATPYDWETGKPLAPIDQARYVRIVIVEPLRPDHITPTDPAAVRNHDPASTDVSNGIHTRKKIAAEIPLPDDGSFYMEIPSRMPYYMQTLNADRMAVRTFDKLLCTVPGEKVKLAVPRNLYPMICAGCHGSTSGRRADVLRRPDAVTSASRVWATWDPETREKKLPFNHGKVNELLSGVDFRHHVQPILDQRCATADCHAGNHPAAGLSLTSAPTRYYNDAYETLMQLEDAASANYGRKKYVDERNAMAVRSYLIEKLYGRELKADRQLSGETPHPQNVPLTDDEKLTFVRWIDLGAPFKGFVSNATEKEAVPVRDGTASAEPSGRLGGQTVRAERRTQHW
jgi:hypothetical protein